MYSLHQEVQTRKQRAREAEKAETDSLVVLMFTESSYPESVIKPLISKSGPRDSGARLSKSWTCLVKRWIKLLGGRARKTHCTPVECKGSK